MKSKKYIAVWSLFLVNCFILTACGSQANSYDTYLIPKQGESDIEPVSSCYVEGSYEGIESEIQETIKTFTSQDELCVIEVKEDYYEVTLDYERGSHAEVGAAYAEVILKAYPQYGQVMEPYLYENIKLAFPNLGGDYTAVEERLHILKASLPEEYQQEMESFAKIISNGEEAFVENGKFSYEEILLAQIIPDALRGTSCSAMAVWGNKSATGKPIAARILEWDLGSENQMCKGHCVVHMKNGDKSITSISVLGLFNILTAVNDNGVFIGEMDAPIGGNFVCEGKTCYTYDLRYALENFETAKDIGNYLIGNSTNYTFSHSLILSDKNNAYCVENCVVRKYGTSLLRDDSTKLHDNLVWDNEDSLCIVNAFAAAVNEDNLTTNEGELVRWLKYNEWIGSVEKLSVTDVKNMLTCEKVDSNVVNVHSSMVFHMVIMDHETGNMHVAFTGTEGVVEKPEFVLINNIYDFKEE